MSQQGPILIVSSAARPPFATALDDAKLFPIVEANWPEASRAVDQLQPAAVLVAARDAAEAGLKFLLAVGAPAIERRNLALTRRCMHRLAEIGWASVTPPQDERRGATVAVAGIEGVTALVSRVLPEG